MLGWFQLELEGMLCRLAGQEDWAWSVLLQQLGLGAGQALPGDGATLRYEREPLALNLELLLQR